MPDRKKWIIGFKACSEAHDSIHSRRHSVFGALIVYIRIKLDLFFRLPNSSTKLLVYYTSESTLEVNASLTCHTILASIRVSITTECLIFVSLALAVIYLDYIPINMVNKWQT